MSSRTTLDSLRERIKAIESGSLSFNEPDSLNHQNSEIPNEGSLSTSKETRLLHQENSSAQPDEAKAESNSAFQRIVSILNAGDKPEKAIRKRLEQLGFTQDAINEAIDKAKDYGFINDARYAEVLIRSRLAQGKGSAGIERELAANDIDIFGVEGWPYSFDVDDESELDRALDLLEHKPPRSKNPREAAYRKLVSKGYSSSVASKAARIWHEGASK